MLFFCVCDTQMSIVMIAMFLVAWSPYSMVCLWASLGDPKTIPAPMAIIAPLFAKSSTFYNPCIYVIANKKWVFIFAIIFDNVIVNVYFLKYACYKHLCEVDRGYVLLKCVNDGAFKLIEDISLSFCFPFRFRRAIIGMVRCQTRQRIIINTQVPMTTS